MIAIIDYDAGNLKSVEKALQHLGQDCKITRNAKEILEADKVILPGVGAFADAMEKLQKYDLIDVIHQVVDKKTPFLGICLGLQLMFESSEEGPGVKGLGILPGKIVRFPEKEGYKIPHMGWNSIEIKRELRFYRGSVQIRMCILCIRIIFRRLIRMMWLRRQNILHRCMHP